MTLSQRTVLIIVSTFIALLFVLAATSDLILLSSFSELERAEILSHTRNIANHLEDKLKQVELTNQHVEEHLKQQSFNARSIRQLFSEHFMRSHALDLAAVFDTNGRLAGMCGFDCNKNELMPVSPERQQALAVLVSGFTAPHGVAVVNLAGSPLMVAYKEIRDTGGIRKGTAVSGWFIDHVELETVFRASGVYIEVFDAKGTLLPEVEEALGAINGSASFYSGVVSKSSVAGYFILKDLAGQPSYIVRALEKRVLYEHGKATIIYILVALGVASTILCGVMLVFIRGTILTRLASLTRNLSYITSQGNISARLPLPDSNDEFKELSLSVNSMLESLENAEAGMRESEERYRMLFERAPDSIIIIGVEGDEKGRIMAANQAAADQHGYTLDELCSLRIFDLNTPKTNEIAADLMATIISGEWVTAELWHQKKDGTRFPIEVHTGLITIGGKKYILGFDRDITQRKLTEKTDQMHLEQIRQLNDELSRKAIDLAAANKELETFNYSASHDMRGPLTRISGYCQLLLDDNTLDPGVRDYVARIYDSELWLNDIIDALLQLAQVPRVVLETTSVDLSAIAEERLKELALEHADRPVRTRIEPDVVVAGDSRLLKMVMINLLNNAWKYSSGTADALIEFGADMTGPDPVYYVRDNGVGFDMNSADKLFCAFTRLHDSEQFEGTGIGLATVQRIIFRHGGRVWAEAEPGTGATFYFTLS